MHKAAYIRVPRFTATNLFLIKRSLYGRTIATKPSPVQATRRDFCVAQGKKRACIGRRGCFGEPSIDNSSPPFSIHVFSPLPLAPLTDSYPTVLFTVGNLHFEEISHASASFSFLGRREEEISRAARIANLEERYLMILGCATTKKRKRKRR